MADICRTVTTVTKQGGVYRNREAPPPEVILVETVRVSSILSNRMDASVLRDLANALDVAGVERGTVTAHRSGSDHLTQLVVEQRTETRVDPDPVEDPVGDGQTQDQAAEDSAEDNPDGE